MSEGSREIEVGGRPRTLARFKSYKVTLALDIMSGVTDQVRELLKTVAAAREEYAKENPVRITRQMCMSRSSEMKQLAEDLRKQASTAEDKDAVEGYERQASELDRRAEGWERQLEDMGDAQYVEFPGQMPQDEEMLVALPEAVKMRKQFAQIIGLALIEDEKLKEAWRGDTVGDVLLSYGQDMLEELEFGEEIEIVVAVRGIVQDQLRPRKRALDGLRELRSWWSNEPATVDGEAKEKPDETPTSDSPTSSTPSPADTDGDQNESSLDSTTERTSPLPTA